MSLNSCLYEGTVWHSRSTPTAHTFRYRLFLVYLDLDELAELFRGHWLWSASPGVAWFRRADHWGAADRPIADCVRELVEKRCGARPCGPIRLLTHLRYFGFAMNPISLYYCFDVHEQLEFVVAEVNNTPWGEQCAYVLDLREQRGARLRAAVRKTMHVSPFLAMGYEYAFQLTPPGDSLTVDIENCPDSPAEPSPFQARLSLRRQPWTTWALSRALLRYPCMTAQVWLGIYWQAFRLWLRQTPYVPHPRTNEEAPV